MSNALKINEINEKLKLILLVLACISINLSIEAQNYKNFKCAIYCRAYEVNKMSDPNWLKNAWDSISMQVHVDKIYWKLIVTF